MVKKTVAFRTTSASISMHCNSPTFVGCVCVQLPNNHWLTSLQPMTFEEGTSTAQSWRNSRIPEARDWPQVVPLLHERAHWSKHCCSFRQSHPLFSRSHRSPGWDQLGSFSRSRFSGGLAQEAVGYLRPLCSHDNKPRSKAATCRSSKI